MRDTAPSAMTARKPTLLFSAFLIATACDSSGGDESATDATGTEGGSTSTTGSVDPSTTTDASTSSSESSSDGGESTSSTGPAGISSSSSSGGSTSGGQAGSEGDVVVNVAYDGALEGTLTVALFGACPPAGPPGAFVQEPEPVFPHAVELSGTAFVAGDMPCVIAYIDTGAPSPTSPGEEDPTGETTLEIAAGEPTMVEVTLEDPA